MHLSTFLNQSIGARLLEERSRIGLSQTEFGAIGGVGKVTQINYEKGDRFPDAQYLAAVAARGVDVLYVVTGVRAAAVEQPLTPEQLALLENYSNADDEGKAAVRYVLTALARCAQGGR